MVRLEGNSVLEFDDVNLVRNDQKILHNLNVTTSEHRIGVVGANGSGKSSFARLLNGLLVPTDGSAKILGHDVNQSTKDVRRQVGFVFQNPDNQIVYPVVSEDIELGLKGMDIPKAERKAKVEEILSRFNLLHLKDRSVHMLSGGEKQMIALSSVLIMEPKMIVFDEPTTLLDLRNRNAVASTIMALEQYVVLVTHDLELLSEFDRVLVFDEGRIAADDSPKEAITWYKRKMAS
ncbi:MAG: ABC transporter ATP-binding protein [Lentilitoribacter sp.]